MRIPGYVAALLLAAGAAVGALSASPAAAHDQLISSTPADGATLTELPAEIVLEFSNELIDAAPALLIRDAADATVHRATPEVAGRVATADFPELGDGTYRLAWSVVSSDGHRIEGFMPFTLATGRPAAPVATAGATTAGAAATSGAASAAPNETPGGLASLGTPLKVALGIGGFGAVAAAAAAVVLRARRGRPGM